MPIEAGIGIYGNGMEDLEKKQVFPETGGSGSIYDIVEGGRIEVGYVHFPGNDLYRKGYPLLVRVFDAPKPFEVFDLTVGKHVEFPLPIRAGSNQLALIVKRTAG